MSQSTIRSWNNCVRLWPKAFSNTSNVGGRREIEVEALVLLTDDDEVDKRVVVELLMVKRTLIANKHTTQKSTTPSDRGEMEYIGTVNRASNASNAYEWWYRCRLVAVRRGGRCCIFVCLFFFFFFPFCAGKPIRDNQLWRSSLMGIPAPKLPRHSKNALNKIRYCFVLLAWQKSSSTVVGTSSLANRFVWL